MVPQPVEVAERGWRALLSISELLEADHKYGLLSRRDVLISWCVRTIHRRLWPALNRHVKMHAPCAAR
jgi:hypothetical protein